MSSISLFSFLCVAALSSELAKPPTAWWRIFSYPSGISICGRASKTSDSSGKRFPTSIIASYLLKKQVLRIPPLVIGPVIGEKCGSRVDGFFVRRNCTNRGKEIWIRHIQASFWQIKYEIKRKNYSYNMIFIAQSLQILKFNAALRNFLAIRPKFPDNRIAWSSRACSRWSIIIFIKLLE